MPSFWGCRCCNRRRSTIGVCWSAKHSLVGTDLDATAVLDYHLMEIDEKTGAINYDRTVPLWVYSRTNTTTGYYLAPNQPASWVIDSDGSTVQEKIDKWADLGSIGLDPSGEWCVFTNRYRLIVTEDTVTEVWDGNSGNPPSSGGSWGDSEREHRGQFGSPTQYQYYNYSATFGGKICSRIGGHVYVGNQSPFGTWYNCPETSMVWQGVATPLSDGGMCAYVFYQGLPNLVFFEAAEFGSKSHNNLWLGSLFSGGVPTAFYYLTVIHGMIAAPSEVGGVLAYEVNDPYDHPTDTLYPQQFAYYNEARLWWTSVDFYDEDGNFVSDGIHDGSVIGATKDNVAIGIWGFIGGDGPLAVETCDVNGNKTLYEIADLEGYEDYIILWSTFSQKSNAWIVALRKDDDWIIARYNLDAGEWSWVVPVPQDGDLISDVWGVSARK